MTAPFAAGATALTVVVPEAEPVVAEHRARLDVAAAYGMPAHVTVLYPWLPQATVTDDDLRSLEELAGSLAPYRAELRAVGRFPETLWLRPEPDDAFRRITDAVWRRWPDAPPYRGQFDDVVPHLTVADGQPDHVLQGVAEQVAPQLPIPFRVDALSLHVFEGSRWLQRRVLPLGRFSPR